MTPSANTETLAENMHAIPAFVGIDLAFAKRKLLPVVICTWHDGCLVPIPLRRLPYEPPRGRGNVATLSRHILTDWADAAARYIGEVCDHLDLRIQCIGIDAPRMPRGADVRRRAAELAMDRAGISCFTTPSATEFQEIEHKVRRHLDRGGAENRIPHANQLWMLAGFRLFERLSQLAPCIEVYPQATAQVLGAGNVHKSQMGAVETQLAEVATHTGWPGAAETSVRFDEIGFGPAHDRLDAYLSAWVAALDSESRIAFGKPPDDVIWAPKVKLGSSSQPIPARVRPVSGGGDAVLAAKSRKRLCPACGLHEFKRWPLGWDAHAAHKCPGVKGTTGEERKRDFKTRYGQTF